MVEMRKTPEELLTALEQRYPAPSADRDPRILSDEEIASGAGMILARSHRPLEDLALYYILFATGARPLEVARLEVRDYLDPTGSVRRLSYMRRDVAINGRPRPLCFSSSRLNGAMDAYLAERALCTAGLGSRDLWRRLDPQSRLFLSSSGRGFEIVQYGENGQRRFLCRAIQETYRKVFRYAGLKGVTALTVRHTFVDRLYARGADESQVGLLLGISERNVVHQRFPHRLPPLKELTKELV